MGIHLSEISPLGTLSREQTREAARALWDEAGKTPGGLTPDGINRLLEPFSLSFETIKTAGWLDAPEVSQRRGVAAGHATLSDLTGTIANAPTQPRMSFAEANKQVKTVVERLQAAPAEIDGISIKAVYLFGSAVRDNNSRPTVGDLDISANFGFDARYDGMDAKTRSEIAKAKWEGLISHGDERLALSDASSLPDMGASKGGTPGKEFHVVKLWENPAPVAGSYTPEQQLRVDSLVADSMATQARAQAIALTAAAATSPAPNPQGAPLPVLPPAALESLAKEAAQVAPRLDYAQPETAGPQISLDAAKKLITDGLEKFDPALAAAAREVLDNPERMNVRTVDAGKGVMMRVRAGNLMPEDGMGFEGHRDHDALKKDFPVDHNPGKQAVIDFQYDGTMKSVVYLAHELGHAVADDMQNKSGHSYRDNPQHMQEVQAYLVQSIVTQALRDNPDPAIARAAQQHFSHEIGKQTAAFPVAEAAREALDNMSQGRPTDAASIMEAKLGKNWQAAIESEPSYQAVFKAMQAGPDALNTAIAGLSDRPASQLMGLAIAEHLQGQDAAARTAGVGAVLGSAGPKSMAETLEIAGVRNLDAVTHAAMTSPSQPAGPLKGWYLLRGYSAEHDPLSTIMDLPKDEAIAKMKEIHPGRGIGEADEHGKRDQTKYYQLRREADQWIADNSTAVKDRKNPIFFALTNDPETVRRHMNTPGNNTLIMPLAEADLSKFSITFDDSMGNYRTTVLDTKNTGINGEFLPDKSPVHGQVLNAEQFAAAIKAHGVNDATGGRRNIEAQYWGTEPLKAEIHAYDPALPKPERPAAGEKTYTIRQVQPGDETDVYRLLQGADSKLPTTDQRHPIHETGRLIEASRNPDANGTAWIAVTPEGRGVGLITTQNFSGGVFVDSNYRKMGIAEGLVLEREGYQIRHGETVAHAGILAGNEGSLRLHEKLGYTFDPGSEGDPKTKDPNTVLRLTKKLSPDPAKPPAPLKENFTAVAKPKTPAAAPHEKITAPVVKTTTPAAPKAATHDAPKPVAHDAPKTNTPDGPAHNTHAKLGRATGVAQIAVDAAAGRFGQAATGAAFEIGLNAKTYEVAAELTSAIKPVAKALGFVGKRIPMVGSVITTGFVLWEAGSYLYEGHYGKATAALGAGAAEAVGNLIGFGVGDVARETVRKAVIETAGDEYAVNKSGIRQLGEGAYEVGSKFVSGAPAEKKETAPATTVASTTTTRPKPSGM
ncbi:MAG: GNAT family N-acetyltransferase [Alphaproteobacteria bacterium]